MGQGAASDAAMQAAETQALNGGGWKVRNRNAFRSDLIEPFPLSTLAVYFILIQYIQDG